MKAHVKRVSFICLMLSLVMAQGCLGSKKKEPQKSPSTPNGPVAPAAYNSETQAEDQFYSYVPGNSLLIPSRLLKEIWFAHEGESTPELQGFVDEIQECGFSTQAFLYCVDSEWESLGTLDYYNFSQIVLLRHKINHTLYFAVSWDISTNDSVEVRNGIWKSSKFVQDSSEKEQVLSKLQKVRSDWILQNNVRNPNLEQLIEMFQLEELLDLVYFEHEDIGNGEVVKAYLTQESRRANFHWTEYLKAHGLSSERPVFKHYLKNVQENLHCEGPYIEPYLFQAIEISYLDKTIGPKLSDVYRDCLKNTSYSDLTPQFATTLLTLDKPENLDDHKELVE